MTRRQQLHKLVIQLWTSALSGIDIAEMFDLNPLTLYSIWSRAKKAGILPRTRRPREGFH